MFHAIRGATFRIMSSGHQFFRKTSLTTPIAVVGLGQPLQKAKSRSVTSEPVIAMALLGSGYPRAEHDLWLRRQDPLRLAAKTCIELWAQAINAAQAFR
jgi:hypothetical protein